MAIGGSGTPSVRVRFDRVVGRLVMAENVVNTPVALIYSDVERGAYGSLDDAVVRLRRGEAIRVGMSGTGEFLRLRELWGGGNGEL